MSQAALLLYMLLLEPYYLIGIVKVEYSSIYCRVWSLCHGAGGEHRGS